MTITATSVIKKILVLFLVFAGLYYAQDFLIPLIIGGVLATLFLPFSKWMESKKVPKGIAVLICLMIFLLVIAAIGTLLGWQILELVRDFDLIKERAVLQTNRIQQYILINYGVSTENQVKAIKNQQSFFTDVVSSIASSITNIVANFVLILVYIFCLIYYRSHIKKFLIKLSPASQQKEMEKIIFHTTRVSQQYLLGLFKMITILWVMYYVGFSILGVKNALFFAILCGLLEIIPFIGNITGTTITLLVAAVNGAGYPMLGGIVLTYSIVQLIQGWILEPLIVGTQVKINPLSTIIALVIGELVWGIPGIFIAIPLIAMFKIVCDHVDSLKAYGSLIGEITVLKKPDLIKDIKKLIK
jgi:predicted PurR-regulated permease PerM